MGNLPDNDKTRSELYRLTELKMIRIEFLGTGTSTGVPQVNCSCEVCSSADVHDKRLRASVLLTVDQCNILIDCGPDFRCQALRSHIAHIDALLVTHSHYDHCGGLDDLRPYCIEKPLPIYAEQPVIDDIKARIPYCFKEHLYPGVPRFEMRPINPYVPFRVGQVEIMPLQVMHYKLPIMGFRIGDVAYITDCLTLPEATIRQLEGLDVLVINALRRTPHLSHQSLDEALALIERLSPRRAYLTHMSHQMGRHSDVSTLLPPNVAFAYDTMTVE